MRIFRIIVFGILFLGQSLFAQGIPYNQEFQVIDEQITPISLGDDKFIGVWTGYDNNGFGIEAQFFNNEFDEIGDKFVINTYQISQQKDPVICGLPNNNFVVFWKSYQQYDEEYSLVGQLFNIDGFGVGDEIYIGKINQYSLAGVITLLDSSIIVYWDNKAQILDKNGGKKDSVFTIPNNTEYIYNLTLCRLNNNEFFACWTKAQGTVESYGCIFDHKGNKIKDDFYLRTDEKYSQYPSAAAINDSSFLVSYYSNSLYYKIFKNNGDILKKENIIYSSVRDEQTLSSIIALQNDKVYVCWSPLLWDLGPEYSNIYMQIIGVDGIKIGSSFKINSNKIYKIQKPSLNIFDKSKILISWHEISKTKATYYLKNPIEHSLTSYSLLEPLNDFITDIKNPTLKWQKSNKIRINFPWEIEYTLFLDEDDVFSSPTIIDSIYDTTYTVQNLTPGTTYFWKVLAKNIAGDSLWSSETFGFFVDYDATAIEEIPNNKIQSFKLHVNYPNPFNPTTTIRYDLPEQSNVNLSVYDIFGRLVKTLVNEMQTADSHKAVFNADGLSSGVYFYSLKAGQYRETKKMLLVR